MKTCAKVLILLVTIINASVLMAQCVPDNTVPKGAILPEHIKLGYVNIPYSEVIYYRAPDDTSAVTQFGTVPVRVDSMEITGVEGLPSGFNYVCHISNCRFKGGEAGCLTVTGTPANVGTYPLKVYIRTYATVITPFAEIPQIQNDTNERFALIVYANVGLNKLTENNLVNIYPNPVKDVLHINTQTETRKTALLYNSAGMLVEQTSLNKNANLKTAHLKGGIYYLKLTDNTETTTLKVVLQ